MSQEKAGQVLFVSSRFPELNLVMKSTATRVLDGRTVPDLGRSITFRRMPFRGQIRGEHLTADAAEIKFLRNHEWCGNVFFEEAAPSQEDRRPPDNRVSQGTSDSGAKEAPIEQPAPEDGTKGVPKVKVAKGLKRGARRKAAPEQEEAAA